MSYGVLSETLFARGKEKEAGPFLGRGFPFASLYLLRNETFFLSLSGGTAGDEFAREKIPYHAETVEYSLRDLTSWWKGQRPAETLQVRNRSIRIRGEQAEVFPLGYLRKQRSSVTAKTVVHVVRITSLYVQHGLVCTRLNGYVTSLVIQQDGWCRFSFPCAPLFGYLGCRASECEGAEGPTCSFTCVAGSAARGRVTSG